MPQVGFKDQKLIRRLKVETRLNPVVNRLNGTKREEAHPDLAAEREAYEKEACTHFCAWHLFNGACDRDFAYGLLRNIDMRLHAADADLRCTHDRKGAATACHAS